jgi:hypothetical protein
LSCQDCALGSCGLDGGLGCRCSCHGLAALKKSLEEVEGRRQAAITMNDRATSAFLHAQDNVRKALEHLSTAQGASNWVLRHFDRKDKHDEKHAELAYEEIKKAVAVLQGIIR